MLECNYKFTEKNIGKLFDSRSKFSEYFASAILKEAFDFNSVRHGNDLDEPDLLFDETEWFEISLICDSKKRNNLVQRIKNRNFKSDDVEEELLNMIQERIEDKSHKKYIDIHPNLCLICPVPMIDWVADFSDIELIFTSEKQKCFNQLYRKYVESGTFKNIFIIVPSIDATWTLIDLRNKRISFEDDLNNANYPYYIME